MSKPKSITEMVQELQRENETLQGLKRLFNRACKDEFGYEPKKIHEMIKRCEMYDRKYQSSGTARQGQQASNEHSE